jgi:hypothetical protein
MIKLLWPAVVGSAISAVSQLGFIYLAESTMPDFKYAAEFFSVAATAVLFWCMTRSMGLAALLGLGGLISFASEIEHQTLGFCCFPGTMKDISGFTWHHLTQTLFDIALIGAWYGLVAVLAYIAARLVASMRPHRA